MTSDVWIPSGDSPQEDIEFLEGRGAMFVKHLDAVNIARSRNALRDAARRLAGLTGRMPHITMRITQWFDWDKLMVNVTHLVSPELVKWR